MERVRAALPQFLRFLAVGGLNTVFGYALALIACRQGYFAKGGAAGVGQATTRSVVQSAVCILMLDYVITSILTRSGSW